ncbi:MAG: GNAT family N-acetyltransferase [Tepidisphaeraceae bacterium]
MPTEFHLRLAQDRDIDAIATLIPLAVRELSEPFYSPREIERAVAHVFGVDRQLISDRTYFVAELDGQIVGCGGWSRRKTIFGGDQTTFKEASDQALDPRVDAARIRAFFVHPQFARRGIGRAILIACESAAREAGFRKLELIATLPGEPLYRACGYRSVSPFLIAMPDGSTLPAVRMDKSIGLP